MSDISEKYELSSLALQENGLVHRARITRRAAHSALPLSFAQQRLWFMDQLEPGNPQCNTPMGVRLRGPLRIAVLQQAMREIVRRHEVLRTVFPTVEGRPVQVVQPESDFQLVTMDLADICQPERDVRAQSIAEEKWVHPFDLASGPLIRVVVLRLAEDEHWLLVTAHQIVFDGWSAGLFIRELAELYKAFAIGKPSPLPDLPIQYADFSLWQRDSFYGECMQEQIDYWRRKLDGVPDVLKLPTDRPRPAVQRFRRCHQSFALPAALAKSLHELAARERTTLFVVLMSAFQVLLYRYSGQEDMVVSSAVSSRNHSEAESLIGCFINILLQRANLAGDPTFVELLHRVHDAVLEAQAHQDLPFEQLVSALCPQRDLSYSPLAQVMMVLNNAHAQSLAFHDLTVSGIPAPETMAVQYDLLITFAVGEEGIQGGVNYNSDLFDAATIERMIINFQTLLCSAVEAPAKNISSLRLMTDDERQQVIVGNNRTESDFPQNQCLHELFETQARRAPDAVAVIVGERCLKYGELNARANVLADRLRQSGIGPESIVAICLHRSVELVIGLMAILKAGGTYVPLDPDYPPDRLSFMMEDSGAKVLLTQSQFSSTLCNHNAELLLFQYDWEPVPAGSSCNPRSGVTPDDLAYIIYTSGSTGRPKGAMLNHRGRVNNFFDFNERFHIGPGDRLLTLSSPSFDMCAYDVFGTLAAGAAILLPERAADRDPKHWAELMIKHNVSVWQSVPALLELLVDAWESSSRSTPLSALRVVLLGGDWIPVTLPDRIRRIAPNVQVISLGGATEVSVHSTIYPIHATDPAWTSIPYGKPMTNQLAYVVDSNFEPVPIGVCGELCLGGVGVGRGYHGRPDLTAEKFIPHPFGQPGERIYRTGDLARWLADGNLELVGRMDHQVKVRGFRIELGEIKTALERHPAVKEAEVLMTGSHADAKKLVAYIVPKGEVPAVSEMQGFLRSALPAYMVPSAFVMLQALPLSPNGKVDRRALPPPDEDAYVRREYEAPRGEVESTLAAIWADILKLELVGRNDNFFELGGSSLLAISLFERMRRKGLITDVRALFAAPMLAELAEVTKEIVEIRL